MTSVIGNLEFSLENSHFIINILIKYIYGFRYSILLLLFTDLICVPFYLKFVRTIINRIYLMIQVEWNPKQLSY